LRLSIKLDPNDADARASYAIFLLALGRRDEGLSQMSTAHALDPVSELTNMLGSYVFYLAHFYDQAIDQANRTLELFPRSTATYYWLGQAYEQKGADDQAFEAYIRANTVGGNTRPGLENLKHAYQKSGMRGYWQEQLKEDPNRRPVGSCWKMQIYAHMRDRGRTLAWLNWGYENHCDGLQFLKVEPIYDAFRDDPRFKELISRLGL
jgi:tetratricopeptide (TPR) repeat protein